MLKIGLVGTGYINRVHALAAKNINDILITSVFGRNKKKAENFAAEFNIPNFYDNYEIMLENCDAVIIGIPTRFHKEFSLRAFEALKHVLCEKPIALTVEDGMEMQKNADAKNVIFMIAQVLRFWPEYLEAKNLIEKNNFGKIKSVSTYRFSAVPEWSSDNWLLNPAESGGVPVDLQIHDIDFIQWLLGKPNSVYAAGAFSKNLIINSKAVLQFENAAAVSEAGYVLPKNGKFQAGFKIITESAVIEYNNLKNPALLISKEGKSSETIHTKKVSSYENQINYFTNCIKNKVFPQRIKTQEAIDALSICLDIKKFIETQNKMNSSSI